MCYNNTMIIIAGKSCTLGGFSSGFNQPPYWNNPKSGTSEIVKITKDYIWYKRGKSVMRISIDLINKIYEYIINSGLLGKKLFTKDIVKIKDTVAPDYKGWNDCDATFVMMLLRYVLGAKMGGKSPYWIII